MSLKLAFYRTALRKKAKKGFQGYPVATVAFYGPDDRRATEVAVGIFRTEDSEAEIERWYSDDADAGTTPRSWRLW